MMKAIPLTDGSASRSFLQASRPPAEAPIATTENSAALRAEMGFDIQRDRFPSTIWLRLPGILRVFSKGGAPMERVTNNSNIRARLRPISTHCTHE